MNVRIWTRLRFGKSTYVGLELSKLQTTAVHFENLLSGLLFLKLVVVGARDDRSRVSFLGD